LPNNPSFTSIGLATFRNTTSLTNIVIPNSVTTIGQSAFDNSGLTNLYIPRSVNRIDLLAFQQCLNLDYVFIPNNVTTIGSGVFENCPTLTIFTEVHNRPTAWNSNWNRHNRPVNWSIIKPENLSHTVSYHDVTLNWTIPANHNSILTGYRVYRGDVLLTLETITTLSFTATDTPGGQNIFRVTAVYDDVLETDPIETNVFVVGFNSPQNLVSNAGTTNINLSWQAPASGNVGTLSSFRVYRRIGESGAFGTHIHETLDSNTLSFSDSDFLTGIVYNYNVTAVYTNPTGESAPSNFTSAVMSVIAIQPSGTGTLTNPYLIGNLANLRWLSETPSAWSSHFRQTADIDATETRFWDGGTGFVSIGTDATPFNGVYDGGNFTIRNFYQNRMATYSGLFGFGRIEVRNLRMENASITVSGNGTKNIGAVAGYGENFGVHMSNVIVDNVNISVSGTGTAIVGAIAGDGRQAVFNNCHSLGTITVNGGTAFVGGIVGQVFGSHNRNSLSSFVHINVTNATGGAVGGLIGQIRSVGTTHIRNVFFTGHIVSNLPNTGGLIGDFQPPASSLEFAFVTSSNQMPTIPVIGRISSYNQSGTAFIRNVFWDMQATGSTTPWGSITYGANQTPPQITGMTTAQMKNPDTYDGWDFANVWAIDPAGIINDGYPFINLTHPSPVDVIATAGIRSVIINWTAPATNTGTGNVTGYRIYRDGAFLASLESTLRTFTDSELTAGTTYTYIVTATYINGESPLTSPVFATPFILTPPYIENFAFSPPAHWTRMSGLLAENSILTQFTNTSWTATTHWLMGNFANNPSHTNGQSSRIQLSGTTPRWWLISPEITLPETTGSHYLSFDLAHTTTGTAQGNANTSASFTVLISTDNGQTWSSQHTLLRWDNQGSSRSLNRIFSTGETVYVCLEGYSGSVLIAFYGEQTVTGTTSVVHVDNVQVRHSATPLNTNPVANLQSTISWKDVTLTWTAPTGILDNLVGYNVFRGTTLLTQAPVQNLTFTETNVADGNYTYRVVAVYDTHSSAPADIRVSVPVISTFPYTENFQTNPVGWTRASGLLSTSSTPAAHTSTSWSLTSHWMLGSFGNSSTHPNGQSAKVRLTGTAVRYWLITAEIDLSEPNAYYLAFDIAHTTTGTASGVAGEDKVFAVMVSVDNGATWSSDHTLARWDNAGSSRVLNNITNVAQRVYLNLSEYTGSVRVTFYGESTVTNTTTEVHIDNVRICVDTFSPPTDLVAVSRNQVIELAWESAVLNNSVLLENGTDRNSPFLGYRIYRNDNPINDLTTELSFVDTNIVNETTYTYNVKAIYTLGESRGSDEVTVSSMFSPRNVTAQVTGYCVTIEWDDPTETDINSMVSTTRNRQLSDSALIANIFQHQSIGATDFGQSLSKIIAERSIEPILLSDTQMFELQYTLDDLSNVNDLWTVESENNIDTRTDRNRTLTGYNIYRENDLIASVPVDQLSFFENNHTIGTHIYHVSAIYTTGESEKVPVNVIIAPPQLHLTPSNHNFGSVFVNMTSQLQNFILTNIGNDGLTIEFIDILNDDANDFEVISGNTLPVTLNANQSINFDVRFTPLTIGSKSTHLVLFDNLLSVHYIPISGVGLPVYPATNLGATAGVSSVTLEWNPPEPHPDLTLNSYNLERKIDDGDWSILSSNLPITSCSFTDIDVDNGTTYHYRVIAIYSHQLTESEPSNEVYATPYALLPPQNLTHSVQGDSVTLIWDEPESISPSLSGFKIFRDIDELATTSITTFTFSDLIVPAGHYVYSVVAVYSSGYSSAITTQVTIIITPGQVTLTSPTNNATGEQINPTFIWQTPTTAGTTGYYIYLDTSENPYNPSNPEENRIETMAGSFDTWWIHTSDLSFDTQYHWQIVAYNENGKGPASESWSFHTILPPIFCIDPITHQFSNVNVHQTSEPQEFTITNTGCADLVVCSISLSEEQFILINLNTLPLIIEASESHSFSVSFSPTTAGLKTANLTITHNASSSPDVVTLHGNGSVSETDVIACISRTELHGNHPNPFNPETTISFTLLTDEEVLIEIYNTRGQKIHTLVNSSMRAGIYSVLWDGRDENGVSVGSGIYFYRMSAGSFMSTQKMILMK
jgi:hypothetical protein